MSKKIGGFEKISILKIIAGLGKITVSSFFPKQYSYSKIYRNSEFENKNLSRAQVSSMLTRLQRDGLVERNGSKKQSVWGITAMGKNFLKKQLTRSSNPKSDGVLRLVIFDIPEKDKSKRYWLRRELIGLNYKILQKSVWIGTVPLPEEFIQDLKVLGLEKHIHIFSVNKAGTLNI